MSVVTAVFLGSSLGPVMVSLFRAVIFQRHQSQPERGRAVKTREEAMCTSATGSFPLGDISLGELHPQTPRVEQLPRLQSGSSKVLEPVCVMCMCT